LRRVGRSVGGYRGRRTLRDNLVLVAVVLAIAVIVVVGGLLVGQRYIVYTDDGPRLDIPFFSGSGAEEIPDAGDVSFVERPGDGAQSEGPAVSQPEEPEEENDRMAALEVTLDAFLSGTAAEQLGQAEADALILNMKDKSGRLGWQSSQTLAETAQVNGSEAENEALRSWNEGDVYTIARVCCFRDDSVPYYRNAVALRAGYGNWRDELGLRWLDPANEDARAYVIALCEELAELGFDEILLECATFPYQGNLETLAEDNSGRAQSLIQGENGFLAQVCRAVEPYRTMVSLRVDRDVVSGEAVDCGLDAVGVERYAHRIWADEGALGAFPADLLAGAGISRAEERFVELTSQLSSERETHQGCLLE